MGSLSKLTRGPAAAGAATPRGHPATPAPPGLGESAVRPSCPRRLGGRRPGKRRTRRRGLPLTRQAGGGGTRSPEGRRAPRPGRARQRQAPRGAPGTLRGTPGLSAALPSPALPDVRLLATLRRIPGQAPGYGAAQPVCPRGAGHVGGPGPGSVGTQGGWAPGASRAMPEPPTRSREPGTDMQWAQLRETGREAGAGGDSRAPTPSARENRQPGPRSFAMAGTAPGASRVLTRPASLRPAACVQGPRARGRPWLGSSARGSLQASGRCVTALRLLAHSLNRYTEARPRSRCYLEPDTEERAGQRSICPH